MMNNLSRLIVLTLPILTGCKENSQQSSQTTAEASPKQNIYIQQPQYLVDKGIKYPYFSYETNEGKGFAMFINPIFDDKKRVLALQYRHGDNIRELFGDEIFGESFKITQKNSLLLNEAFLIYRPLNIKSDWKWRTKYANEDFDCRLAQHKINEFKIHCASLKYSLNFTVSNERGVTIFQDFLLLCEEYFAYHDARI